MAAVKKKRNRPVRVKKNEVRPQGGSDGRSRSSPDGVPHSLPGNRDAPEQAIRSEYARQAGERYRRGRRKRKKRLGTGISADFIYKLFLFTALAAAVILVVTIFFKVTDIEVVGTEKCLPEKIRAASGIEMGDKLLFINRKEVVSSILEKEPYVDAVKVKRRPPNTVILEIVESKPAAIVEQNGTSYVIDKNAKLLEWMPSAQEPSLPVVTGMTITDPVAGKLLPVDDELALDSLNSILEYVIGGSLSGKISGIDMEKLYDISFIYDGRFRVKIGDTDEMEQKMTFLDAVVSKLTSTDKGTIDIKDPSTARFLPNYGIDTKTEAAD